MNNNTNMRYHVRTFVQDGEKLEAGKQAAGIAPNFVHSCDASHMMFTVLGCLNHYITAFHMIHDSYGTHAANSAVLGSLFTSTKTRTCSWISTTS